MVSAQPVRARLALVALLLLSAWQLADAPSALAWRQPGLVPGVPSDIRSPKIAGEGNRVHMVTFQAADKELLYSRGTTNADGSVSWERPRRIANDVKLSWNIAADASGTVHVAYATGDGRLLYIRNPRRGDLGNWSSPQQIAQMKQANEVDIALDAANTPYVAWGQNVDPSNLRMAYRAADGSWVAREIGGRAYLYRYAALVVTGSGDSARVHVMTELKGDRGSQLQILYASGPRNGPFQLKSFSGSYSISNLAAQPTMALDRLTGTIYTGFFSGRDLDFQFRFSYSRDNGATWAPLSSMRLGDDLSVTEKSPMVAGNNRAYIMLQVKRVGDGGFTSSGFYGTEFNPDNRSFTAPSALRDVRGTDYKNVTPDLAINVNAKVGVWVPGFTAGAAYNSEPGGVPEEVVTADRITVNDGAAFTRSPNVTIKVVNPKGSPTGMRVAINQPVTAATALEPFQETFSRTLPAGCRHTVNVELANSQGASSDVYTATITLDGEFGAGVRMLNPRDGAPGFTREQSFRLQVIGVNECSGLKSVRGGASEQTLGAPATITNSVFDATLPMPASTQPGPYPLVFQVDDLAGNVETFSTSIVYDPTPPRLMSTGKLTVTVPTTGTTILPTLVFTGSEVSDAGFGGRGFWGVQLLNSRSPISDTARAGLPWATVQAPGEGSDFTLGGWSLLAGIAPEARTPGTYYVYARFVDGAGNATTGVVSGTVTLEAVSPVEVRLPEIGK